MKRFASLVTVLLLLTLSLAAQSTKVLITTTMGDITVMLYDDTPLHKDNFIELVNKKFYDGLLFHRVMAEFMVQTGDPESKGAPLEKRLGTGGPGYTIPAEIRINHFHKKGALAAARQPDQVNPKKESSGSQFYLVVGKKWTDAELPQFSAKRRSPFTEAEIKTYKELGGTPHLDFEYTVFGEIVQGLEVIDAISKVKCAAGNRPVQDVKIITARIVK